MNFIDFLTPSNIYLILYSLAWLVIIRRHFSDTSRFGPGTFLLLTYFIFSVCSIFLFNSELNREWPVLTLFPFIYLLFFMWLTSLPIIKYDKYDIQGIYEPDRTILNGLIILCSLCSISQLLLRWDSIVNGLNALVLSSYAGADLYEGMSDSLNDFSASINQSNVVTKLLFLIYSHFRDFSILFLFFYLTLENKKTVYVILLLLNAIADILWSLSIGNRTGAVLPMFTMLITFLAFAKYYTPKLRKGILIGIASIGTVMSVLIIVLTISRFTDDYRGTGGGMLEYAGQANLYFNTCGLDDNGIRYGDRTCFLFKRYLGFDVPKDRDSVNAKYSGLKVTDSHFYTYIGDFTIDFGPYVAALIFIFFSLLFLKITKPRDGCLTFPQIIALYFVMCVCARGGMYLYDFGYWANQRIIGFIVLYVIFSLKPSENSLVRVK